MPPAMTRRPRHSTLLRHPLPQEALAGRLRAFGDANVVTLRLQTELAGLLHDKGQHAEARACLGDALSTARNVCNEDDPLIHR